MGFGQELRIDGADPVANRFKAFVSYSHADKAEAQKLHRKLEAYRLPKHLRQDAVGLANDGRVGAIFRDREDLPAAEDLTESVKLALSGSEALVVLCSPNAKKSPWVAREIELFRELHPARPILAALLSGEPEEAFPAPLRDGREPLAADLRKDQDGPRLGFLKVVAGIAGVPLDALVNRDAQRRVRRVTAITVAALAAMVVMALMTTFALKSRDEAQTQRAEAEGVVEFMMTDLRTDLRGVGRLDVMESVNQRAIDFYEGQGDITDLPVESALRWARILHALGEDETIKTSLDYAKANDYFERANKVTAEILADDPADAVRVYSHAQSQFWLGYNLYLQKQFKSVAPYWLEYDRLAKDLRELASDEHDGERETGFSQGSLCTLALDEAQAVSGKATEYCARSLGHMQAVHAANDNEQSKLDLVNRLNWYSRALELDEEVDASPEVYVQALEITESLLAAHPQNRDFRDVWLTIQIALAETEIRRGQRNSAISRLKHAEGFAIKLTAEEPDNVRWNRRIQKISEHLKGGKP
ncbi:hypothetical protein GCM10023115_01210 [Pontixanthobacter gangjinensis]|uniref:TIR domain-containing protein n=1 Tax=Pontixanthobacter gangjinensis TaxID=1028742 RepID=A0A6I4SKR0_9SPHN|nr:toll/interleukin-1 receptor domain-containing protein [Pontixanthobacter gangjinensis]MXO55377.1 TIR domain-containing protein [Pontixanthobacter gangjinensis]